MDPHFSGAGSIVHEKFPLEKKIGQIQWEGGVHNVARNDVRLP